MSLSLLLLLLGSARASLFHGSVLTYYPINTNEDGSTTVRSHCPSYRNREFEFRKC